MGLQELLNNMAEVESDTSHNVPTYKLVKCPKCGEKYPAPPGTEMVMCRNCRTIEEPNNDILTSDSYSLARDKTIVKKKITRCIPATHDTDSTRYDKTKQDDT